MKEFQLLHNASVESYTEMCQTTQTSTLASPVWSGSMVSFTPSISVHTHRLCLSSKVGYDSCNIEDAKKSDWT